MLVLDSHGEFPIGVFSCGIVDGLVEDEGAVDDIEGQVDGGTRLMELADLVVLVASKGNFNLAVLSSVWLAATLGVVAAGMLVETFLLGWGSWTYHRGMLGSRCEVLRDGR